MINDKTDLINRINKAFPIVTVWAENSEAEANYLKELAELKAALSVNKGFHVLDRKSIGFTNVLLVENSFHAYEVPTWDELDSWTE